MFCVYTCRCLVCLVFCCFFFFKQKTAYEMRISDWSSDVCSSDLLDGPPLVVTRTDGATPFRLVTHIGDVGHTVVVGPTGAGKSVLLAMLVAQFRRYAGSRVFVFEMGRSLRATLLGLGGEYHDLGLEGEAAFQPLARVDDPAYRSQAAEWVEGRLAMEGVVVGPEEKAAVWSALGSLASAPVAQRTMTGLSALLQSNRLRQALAPYVLGGAHGRLLDADHDRLGTADVQGFEMEDLMPAKAAANAVIRHLFARMEERLDGAPTLLVRSEEHTSELQSLMRISYAVFC